MLFIKKCWCKLKRALLARVATKTYLIAAGIKVLGQCVERLRVLHEITIGDVAVSKSSAH